MTVINVDVMTENQHHQNAREALGFLENSDGSYVDPTTQALATAQIEATLALAHEQRTANLIAAYQAEVTGQGRIKGDGAAIDRHNEILDRLGL